MAYIPRRNYAQAHLDGVKLVTGINDWFSFLDRHDRLVQLMYDARPPVFSENDKDSDKHLTWDYLGILEWYGVWIHKTSKEDWLFRQIAKLNGDWQDCGGFFDPTGEKAGEGSMRYRRLVQLADTSKSAGQKAEFD